MTELLLILGAVLLGALAAWPKWLELIRDIREYGW